MNNNLYPLKYIYYKSIVFIVNLIGLFIVLSIEPSGFVKVIISVPSSHV